MRRYSAASDPGRVGGRPEGRTSPARPRGFFDVPTGRRWCSFAGWNDWEQARARLGSELRLREAPVRVRVGVAMGYAIRNAVADDFADVQAFLDDHLRRDYFIPGRQLREILTGRYHEMILAIDDARVIGLAIMTKAQRTLVNLLVAPCERNRGIGDALLSRLRVERVRAKLNVSAGDPSDYYAKRGFRRSSERTGKKHILIMTIDLDSPPRWL